MKDFAFSSLRLKLKATLQSAQSFPESSYYDVTTPTCNYVMQKQRKEVCKYCMSHMFLFK